MKWRRSKDPGGVLAAILNGEFDAIHTGPCRAGPQCSIVAGKHNGEPCIHIRNCGWLYAQGFVAATCIYFVVSVTALLMLGWTDPFSWALLVGWPTSGFGMCAIFSRLRYSECTLTSGGLAGVRRGLPGIAYKSDVSDAECYMFWSKYADVPKKSIVDDCLVLVVELGKKYMHCRSHAWVIGMSPSRTAPDLLGNAVDYQHLIRSDDKNSIFIIFYDAREFDEYVPPNEEPLMTKSGEPMLVFWHR